MFEIMVQFALAPYSYIPYLQLYGLNVAHLPIMFFQMFYIQNSQSIILCAYMIKILKVHYCYILHWEPGFYFKPVGKKLFLLRLNGLKSFS